MTIEIPLAPAPELPGQLLYQVLAGSHAYGLATTDSDADWRGVYQLPTEAYLGVRLPGKFGLPETVELPPDQVYYELRHFASLVLAGNPNIMELLWAEPHLVAVTSPVGEALRALRGQYLHTKMLAAYLGWTTGEKMRLTRDGELSPDLAGKRGSHLMRLLLSLRHALVDGVLVVTLTGAERDEALSVKLGQVTPAEALARIEELERECRAMAERANWPNPDSAAIEAVVLAARRGEL